MFKNLSENEEEIKEGTGNFKTIFRTEQIEIKKYVG